jgi:hypothetical protein
MTESLTGGAFAYFLRLSAIRVFHLRYDRVERAAGDARAARDELRDLERDECALLLAGRPVDAPPQQGAGQVAGVMCKDGTRSAKSGRGGCSHHGGLAAVGAGTAPSP